MSSLDLTHPGSVVAHRKRSERALRQVLPELVGKRTPDHVVHDFRGSNDLLCVRVGSRRLMLKRGLEPWSADRFRTARVAARLIAEGSDIRTPRFLDVPECDGGWPLLAWWRLEHTTLDELWPKLDLLERASALSSLGALLAQLHRIPIEGWGPPRPSQRRASGRPFLLEDLEGRLRPAVLGSWPEALPLLDEAVELVTSSWSSDPAASLAHNDVHLSNVLCEIDAEGVHCVGLLDLEAVGGALPEADLSYLSLVHSPGMAGSLGRGWMERVLAGYGRSVDERRMRLFRLHHILNIGIHAALAGDHDRAAYFADVGGARV